MGVASDNPFGLLYNAIWAALISEHEFARRVTPGNRERFDLSDDPDPRPDVLPDGAAPAVSVLPASSLANLTASSTSAHVTQNFVVSCESNDLRLGVDVFPLKWAILRAMAIAGATNLGLDFVKKITILDSVEGIADNERRGREGWAAITTISVECHFLRERLTRVRGS